MKKNIFTLLAVLLTTLPIIAVKKVEANPINIAAMLAQENDTAKMSKTCDYYGYTRAHSLDEYTIFKHSNGSIIRYKHQQEDLYPTIEVHSKISEKEKEQILKSLNFQKHNKEYVRKSVGYTTKCINGKHGDLIFTCHTNQHE